MAVKLIETMGAEVVVEEVVKLVPTVGPVNIVIEFPFYVVNYIYSTKRRAWRATAPRADIARGIPGLPVTYPTDPTHWTRPLRPGSSF